LRLGFHPTSEQEISALNFLFSLSTISCFQICWPFGCLRTSFPAHDQLGNPAKISIQSKLKITIPSPRLKAPSSRTNTLGTRLHRTCVAMGVTPRVREAFPVSGVNHLRSVRQMRIAFPGCGSIFLLAS